MSPSRLATPGTSAWWTCTLAAVDDRVHLCRYATTLDDGHGRVDDDRLTSTAHEQGVARRIRAVPGTGEHADGVSETSLVGAPIDA
jgi:hypothetical protein